MRSKRHHYLPQFYLQYLLPEDGTGAFWVYDKDGGEPRPQTPVNTCVEGNLYSLADGEGGRHDRLESELFSPLDGMAKPVFDRWIEPTANMRSAEVQLMAEFIAFLHTRVPRNMAFAEQIMRAIYENRRRHLLEKPDELTGLVDSFSRARPDRAPLDVKDLRLWFDEFDQRFRVKVNPDHVLAATLNVAKDVCEQLLTMRWHLVTVRAGAPLVTSDAPVVVFVPHGQSQALFGAGIGLPEAQVTFAISPRVCLFLDRGPINDRGAVELPPINEVNKRAILNAERFVISPKKDAAIADLVKRFSTTRGKPKIDPEQIHHRIDWDSMRHPEVDADVLPPSPDSD